MESMRRSLLFSVVLIMLASLSALTANAQTYNWTGTDPATAAKSNSTVYLWNVAKQKFLEKGGRWGTEAVLGTATNGQAFTVVTSGNSYKLKADITPEGSDATDAYLTFMGPTTGSVNSHDCLNYFVDQSNNTYSVFNFTSTTGGYYIICSSYYYMCANYNSSSSSESDNSANAINASYYSDSRTNDVWLLVTEEERTNYFSSSTQAGSANAGGTFFIKDYDFARKDKTISSWLNAEDNSLVNGSYSDGKYEHSPADYNAKETSTTYYIYSGTCSVGKGPNSYNHTIESETTEKSNYISYYCSQHNKNVTLSYSSSRTETTSPYTYYVGNGLADGNDQESNGGKWTANIHGAAGKVYQTITVPVAGIYRIKCKGFTTVEGAAKLFATNSSNLTSSQLFSTNADIDVTTATYIDAYTALQDAAYSAVVDIYVEKDATLTFGVEVADGKADGWTSFDDFELEYIGEGKVFVILDETKESVDYLQAQNDNETVKAGAKPTIYLHRSLTANKWNSIVLPISLTADEVTSAFGAGTIVSKFKGATDENHPTRLYFEQASGIEKDQLYLIKPTTAEPTGQAKVTATGTMSDNSVITLEGAYYTLNIAGGFYRADYTYPEAGQIGGTDTGKETYTGDTNLEFKGTYIKKANQVPAKSYMLYAGATDTEGSTGEWVYREKTSSSRAFRGWLQPVTTTAAKPVIFYINGIEAGGSETTAIEDALINTDSHSVSGNIYNLNGQMVRQNATSTEGLAKGVYIVGGKKVVVR